MKILMATLLLAAAPAWGQTLFTAGEKTVTRNYQISNEYYTIEFKFNTSWFSRPATLPAGHPHYAAKITVCQIINGQRLKVGDTFDGQYTEHGCFEDEPSSLVQRAKLIEAMPPTPTNCVATASTDQSVEQSLSQVRATLSSDISAILKNFTAIIMLTDTIEKLNNKVTSLERKIEALKQPAYSLPMPTNWCPNVEGISEVTTNYIILQDPRMILLNDTVKK